MSAKKPPAPKKPPILPRDVYISRTCGVLSGINDHLGMIQQQCMDVSSRCQHSLALDKELQVLTEGEKEALANLQLIADSQFTELSGYRAMIETIMRRSPSWHGPKFN